MIVLLLVGWLEDHFATKLRVETHPDFEASGGLLYPWVVLYVGERHI
jgi:hypothetical protein